MAQHPKVGIIMGSTSDWPTMKHAADVLAELGVAHEAKVVSAHRTPDRLYDYAKTAKARGLKVIIAGAGGAAHLPGMTASMTTLPVLGVPVADQGAVGPGQPALHRADAGRRAGRHAGHRHRPAPPTPGCWRRRSWRSATTRSPRGWRRCARSQTAAVPEAPHDDA